MEINIYTCMVNNFSAKIVTNEKSTWSTEKKKSARPAATNNVTSMELILIFTKEENADKQHHRAQCNGDAMNS